MSTSSYGYLNGSINGHNVSFDGETMIVRCASNVRHAALNPQPAQNPRYRLLYVLTYSPTDGAMINGVSTKNIQWTPELTAFIQSITGGAKFAACYAQAKKDVAVIAARMSGRKYDYSAPNEL